MRSYAAAVGLIDFAVLSTVTLITYLVSYGDFQNLDNIENEGTLRVTLSPQFLGAVLLVSWLISLSVFKSRDLKIVGSDFSEYKRVFNASLAVIGGLAFTALFFKVDVSRVYVTSILVFGTLSLLISRKICRSWLKKQRRAGKYRRRVALYGPIQELEIELKKYSEMKELEFDPVMTITDNNLLKIRYLDTLKEKEVDLEHFAEVLDASGVEVVQVVGSSPSAARMHKSIYRALDGWNISLVISPAITDVANSKLTTRVIAGSPLMEISTTKFTGPQYVVKQVLDLVLGTIAFLVSSPIVLVAALLVKLEDKGPAFFKQTRVGLNGKEFTMYKIRSMKVGAELEHAELQAANLDNATNTNMYKNPEDPRVTKVGKCIRKYSIDELPQFLNVLRGDMSMVGPRPPMTTEVQEWKTHETRRLLVKPGVTGPWQIGGRSLLTWEETVAIDLEYVENWTVLKDLSIVLRTILFVLKGRGAF